MLVIKMTAAMLQLFVQAHGAAPAPGDMQHILEQRVQSGESIGISAVVIENGKTQFYNAGTRSKSSDVRVDEHTVYEIGSITKVFTALLLADMAQKGEVKLDDPIDAYLPKGITAPRENEQSITLRQLSQHTSALPRLPDNLITFTNFQNPYSNYTDEKLFAYLDGRSLPRAIGEKYEYSNLGMGLLGTLLARRAQSNYYTLIHERICAPMGMHETCGNLTPELQDRLATGHRNGQEVPGWDFLALAGCGGLRSTTADLAVFLENQVNVDKSPLSKAIHVCLDREKEFDTGNGKTTVTLGWHVTNKRGKSIYWHNGGTGGYKSFIGFDLASHRAIGILSNTKQSVDELGMQYLSSKN